MTHSPPRSQSGKDAANGERKETESEETARFKDLAKKLLKVSKEHLQHEIDKSKIKRP